MLLTPSLSGQENSAFVDSILSLVVSHQIPVFNGAFKPLDNGKVVVIRYDTVINDQWTRPKYINNILHESFDGVAVGIVVIFDTATNTTNNGYLEFRTAERDTEGNFMGNKVAFLINKSIQPRRLNGIVPPALITSEDAFWQNAEIQISDKTIALDSCNALYRLEFYQDFTFKQYYNKNERACYSAEMGHNIEVGVEGDAEEFFEYFNKLQGHYIDPPTGFWRIEKGNLVLENREKRESTMYRIINLTDNEMFLELAGTTFKVKLKKVI